MRKVIAFDFDLTLSRYHSVGERITAQDINQMSIKELKDFMAPVFADPKFINFLKSFTNSGHLIVVVSYGFNEVIYHALRRLNLVPNVISMILTPKSFGLEEGCEYLNELQGKNLMLNMINHYYQIGSNNNIILVDDSLPNIEQAKKAGYQTLLISQRQGLNQSHLPQLYKFVNQ